MKMECMLCRKEFSRIQDLQLHYKEDCDSDDASSRELEGLDLIPQQPTATDEFDRQLALMPFTKPCPAATSSPTKVTALSATSRPVPTNEVGKRTTIQTVPVDYILNEKLALCKKREACDRKPFTIKHNKFSTTLSLNTVAFELFRQSINHYLRERKKYKTSITVSADKCGSIVKETIRVLNTNTPIYTINLHTTTSCIMVNGPEYANFIQNNIPVVLDNIDEMAATLEIANDQTKNTG